MSAENVLKWKILPRFMMFVMTIMYIRVIEWFIDVHDSGLVTVEATALTATVTGAMTGAFGLWLGSENKS
jgi:hypothetical protein